MLDTVVEQAVDKLMHTKCNAMGQRKLTPCAAQRQPDQAFTPLREPGVTHSRALGKPQLGLAIGHSIIVTAPPPKKRRGGRRAARASRGAIRAGPPEEGRLGLSARLALAGRVVRSAARTG